MRDVRKETEQRIMKKVFDFILAITVSLSTGFFIITSMIAQQDHNADPRIAFIISFSAAIPIFILVEKYSNKPPGN